MNPINPLPVPPVVVCFTRGGIVESRHRGYACISDADGRTLFHLGDPGCLTFLRSSAKPLQALAAVVSGAADHFRLTPREIAIISGSHGGEDYQVETVQSILHKIELDDSALRCGIHPPLDAAARTALEKSGHPAGVLHHNCSGKHAGMLAAALRDGLAVEDYLEPQSSVQRRITDLIAVMAGVSSQDVVLGWDGCSAPVHGLPLKASARAWARLADPRGLAPSLKQAVGRVAGAMRDYPEMVAARQDRICTQLILAGAHVKMLAKAGAEGFYAAGWIDPATNRGVGLAVKIDDGAQRARDPLTMAILQKMGVFGPVLPENLTIYGARPITNWAGKVVGETVVNLAGE